MMPGPTGSIRTDERHKTNHAEDEKTASCAESSAPLACGDSVDLPQATLPIIGLNRHHRLGVWSAILAISIFILFAVDSILPCSAPPPLDSAASPLRSVQHVARATSQALLEVFQVYPPVLTVTPEGTLEITDGSSNASVEVIPSRRPTCQETLVVHSFTSSYGVPYVGPYTPPSCSFNRVTWNLTVTSAGRQYDRLGSVSFGDVELFRTSTAEPTTNGIVWTYLKDMTNFLRLFKTEQTIIFDLGNIITDIYTGPFNVTLTASFFTADDSISPADLIVPVSRRQGAAGQASYFSVPSQNASSDLTLPRNIKRAVFTIAATGQASEEFWWSNVLQSQIHTFPAIADPLPGYSPFREVQLYIDEMLAGVVWPFPIIFTGGIVPGLWRPIVGIDTFDLKEDEIDITPFLPLLCDGNAHTFTIRVSGLNDNGNGSATLSETTDDNWWVAGKVFLWLDRPGHITTGQGPDRSTPNPSLHVSSSLYKTANGTNETLLYQVNAQRSLSLRSSINLSQGKQTAYWSQSLTYINTENFTDMGNIQVSYQQTDGHDVSSSGYGKQYSYPLNVYSTSGTIADNITYTADVHRGKDVQTIGQPVFPTGLESFSQVDSVHPAYRSFQGASLSTTQNGSATYLANSTTKASYSFGTTAQEMTFSGVRVVFQNFSPARSGFPRITQSNELFHRYAMAVNGTVVEDQETLVDDSDVAHYHGAPGDGHGALLSGSPGRGRHAGTFGGS